LWCIYKGTRKNRMTWIIWILINVIVLVRVACSSHKGPLISIYINFLWNFIERQLNVPLAHFYIFKYKKENCLFVYDWCTGQNKFDTDKYILISYLYLYWYLYRFTIYWFIHNQNSIISWSLSIWLFVMLESRKTLTCRVAVCHRKAFRDKTSINEGGQLVGRGPREE